MAIVVVIETIVAKVTLLNIALERWSDLVKTMIHQCRRQVTTLL